MQILCPNFIPTHSSCKDNKFVLVENEPFCTCSEKKSTSPTCEKVVTIGDFLTANATPIDIACVVAVLKRTGNLAQSRTSKNLDL